MTIFDVIDVLTVFNIIVAFNVGFKLPFEMIKF